MKRHRALTAFLEAESFNGRSKHSMRLLRELAEYAELRTGLAHGRIRKQFGKVLLEWKRCRGEARQHSLSFDLTETYADLLKLDKLQRDLRSELGQIRKAVSTRPL